MHNCHYQTHLLSSLSSYTEKALIETGITDSAISKCRVPLDKWNLIPTHHCTFQNLMGKTFDCNFIVTLPVKVGLEVLMTEFHVLDCKNETMLGMDFISKHVGSIHVEICGEVEDTIGKKLCAHSPESTPNEKLIDMMSSMITEVSDEESNEPVTSGTLSSSSNSFNQEVHFYTSYNESSLNGGSATHRPSIIFPDPFTKDEVNGIAIDGINDKISDVDSLNEPRSNKVSL